MWNKWWISQLILSFTIRNYLFLCHNLLHSVLQQSLPCRLEQISVLGCYCSTRFSCLSQCCSKKMEYLCSTVCTRLSNTWFTSSWVMCCIGEANLWADTSWNKALELQYLGTLRLEKLPKQCFGCPQCFTASSALSASSSGVQSSVGNHLCNITAMLLFYGKHFLTDSANWMEWVKLRLR